MENSKIGVYTSICEEDAIWIPQYLKEIERMGLDFVVHFDRCSNLTKLALMKHDQCVGWNSQDDPVIEFGETHKQKIFDLLVEKGYDYACAWDMDEVWHKDAPSKLHLVKDYDYIDVPFYHLWGDEKHIRIDEEFGRAHRVKFHNLKTFSWRFASNVVNGPKNIETDKLCRYGWIDMPCIHYGLMSPESRKLHQERWDRVYGAHGGNPYGLWALANNTEGIIQEYDW